MEPRAPLPTSAAPEVIAAGSRAPLSREALGDVAAPIPAECPAGPPDAWPPDAVDAPAVVALSEDQGLLQAVTGALTGQATVVSSPSVDRFVDQLVSNGAEIAVIDTASAPNLIDFLNGLHRQFPQLQLIVVGSTSIQEELTSQIADCTMLRYVDRPASAAEPLKLMLSTALHIGRPTAPPREQASLDDAAGDTADDDLADDFAGDLAGDLAGDTISDARPRWLWPLLLCLTALGAMVVGWYATSFVGQTHLLP